MAETLMESYKEFLSLYNQYRIQEDVQSALRMAHEIEKIAKTQSARNDLPKQIKDFYATTSAPVREWLASIKISAYVTKTSGNDSVDTIRSTDWFDAEIPKLSMRDVAGLKELRDQFLVNVFAPISPKYAPIYKKYRGNDLGMQILLYGPPGCGKTFIVKCLAGTLRCKIAVVQVKDVMANLVGDGAKIINEIFDQANKMDRCIIFFDEIDAIAADRDDDESRHTKEQLTTLLTKMDGFTSRTKPGQIRLIVAATNRPWILDNAIKRGGRFENQFYVPLPDFDARKKMIEIALGKDNNPHRIDVPCAENVTVDWLADKLEGYSGADIKAICRQILNQPLRREIDFYRDHGKFCYDFVTQADCETVIGHYINGITDELLFAYDAYKANMSVSDYLALFKPKALADKASGKNLSPHVMRWIQRIDNATTNH